MSATNPDLTSNGWDTFHRVVASDAAQGPAAAALMETLGFEAIFLIDDASDYGVGLGGEITKALDPALVVGTDQVQQGDTDFSTPVTKVTAANADALYYSGYAPEAALFLQQLRNAGWEGTFLSGDGTVDAAFLGAGEFTEGTILTFPGILDAGEEFTAKWDALETDEKGAIGAYTLEAYDAAWVLLSGIGEGNTTREDLLAWVNDYDAEGLTKQIKFAENGEVDGASGVFYYTVEGGATVYGGPAE
jgi:branched-chain amino acid transport system substrate-binding protein